jgi:hypothetical protein
MNIQWQKGLFRIYIVWAVVVGIAVFVICSQSNGSGMGNLIGILSTVLLGLTIAALPWPLHFILKLTIGWIARGFIAEDDS